MTDPNGAARNSDPTHRALQLSSNRVQLAFESCLFRNNFAPKMPEFPSFTQNGVVNAMSSFTSLTVSNCVFSGNDFGEVDVSLLKMLLLGTLLDFDARSHL